MTIYAPLALAVQTVTSDDEFAVIVDIRRRVFRDEQQLVDLAVTDSDDAHSVHVCAMVADEIVATGRLTPPRNGRIDGQIAWVATLEKSRERGAATALVRRLLEIADEANIPAVTLSAQTHAVGLYERLGFRAYGAPFVVRGIEHQSMERRRPLTGVVAGEASS